MLKDLVRDGILMSAIASSLCSFFFFSNLEVCITHLGFFGGEGQELVLK